MGEVDDSRSRSIARIRLNVGTKRASGSMIGREIIRLFSLSSSLVSLVLKIIQDQVVHRMIVTRLGRLRKMPCMINVMLVPGNVLGTVCGQISQHIYVVPDELIKAIHSNVTITVKTVERVIEMPTVL